MEKKKLKLSISGSTKKTINSIEQAKTKSKNTVVIEKRPTRFQVNHILQDPIQTKINLNLALPFLQRKPTSQNLYLHQTLVLKKEN